MEKISPISTNLIQNYTQVQKVNAESAKQVQTAPEVAPEIVKKETADAAKAYAGIVAPKARPPFEKKSLDELKSELLAQGKVEGKDFEINKFEKISELTILENGKPSKVYVYKGSATSKDDLFEYQERSYPIGNSHGLREMETCYDADGSLKLRYFEYDKDNSPYKNELINNSTELETVEKYLQDNNIKYCLDDGKIINGKYRDKSLTTFDPKTNDVIRYDFCYEIMGDEEKLVSVSKADIGKDGTKLNDLHFCKDCTIYYDYQNNVKY